MTPLRIRRRVVLFRCCRCCCGCDADEKPTLLVDSDHRTSISLDGDWHAIVDPYDNGYLDFRMQARPDGYFLNEKPDASQQTGGVRLLEVGRR